MKDLIWYEKYRGRRLKDLSLPPKNRRAFKSYIKQGEIPHLLFHGPVGSGKTTVAMILIDKCASSSLTLNASSDDRGIATIKTKVKQFAMSKSRNPSKKNIILLDEADGLTSDSQNALRNIIEKYHDNCRFIFTANEIDKINDAIYSRCTFFAFDAIEREELLSLLKKICENEGVEYKTKDLYSLIDRFGTDVRTIINNLQAGSSDGEFRLKNITGMTIDDEELFSLLLDGKIGEIRRLLANLTDFIWVYKLLFDKFLMQISEDVRSDVAISIAEYLYRDKTVADRQINMIACLCEIAGEYLEVKIKL